MPDQMPPAFAGVEAPTTTLRTLPASAQFVFRGRPPAVEAARTVFGALPASPCQAVHTGTRAALWQGPDELLLIAPAAEQAAIEEAFATALATIPHALVAVSHRNMTLELAGPQAARMLNAGCPLNLALSAFPVDMCTRTVLAKAPILLWRTGTETFIIGVWRSFLPYTQHFLLEAQARL